MKKIIFILVILIAIPIGSIIVVNYLKLDSSLKDAIIAEIIGGGIFAVIVGGAFYYLQESNEYTANKNKSQSFYDNKLKIEFKEAKAKGPSVWKMYSGCKFYFCYSHINDLYDIYENNFELMQAYMAYFPKDNQIIEFTNLYKKAKSGYIICKKADELLGRMVREFNYENNIESYNDGKVVEYLKYKIYANGNDKEIIKYLQWKEIPEKNVELFKICKGNKELDNLFISIKEIKNELLKLDNLIVRNI